jgi:hypothetical protein
MGSTDLDSDLESLLLPATAVVVHHAVYPYYNLGAPSLPPPRVLSQRLCIYTTDEQRPRYYAGAASSGNSSGLLSMPASPHGAAVTGTGLTRGGVTSSNSPSVAAAGTTAVSYSNSGYTASSSSSDAAGAVVASPQSALKRPFSKLSIRKFGSIGGSVPADSTSPNSPSGSNSSSKRRETAGGDTTATGSSSIAVSPRRVANAHERPKMEDVAQRRGKSTGGRGGY